jgi:hypothetical protein
VLALKMATIIEPSNARYQMQLNFSSNEAQEEFLGKKSRVFCLASSLIIRSYFKSSLSLLVKMGMVRMKLTFSMKGLIRDCHCTTIYFDL